MFQQNITLTNKLLQQNSSHRQTTSNDISFYIESSLSKNNENVCLSYFSTPSIGSKKQAFCPILPTASILFSKHTFTYQSIHRIIRKYPNTCTTTQILVGLWMKKKRLKSDSRSQEVGKTHIPIVMDTLNVEGCHYGKCLSRGRVLLKQFCFCYTIYIFIVLIRKNFTLVCTIKYNGLTQHNNVCT